MTDPRPARAPETHRLIQNTAVNAVAQVVAIGTGLLLLPYMVGRMGTELYGLVLVVQIFSVSGVLAFADAGLTSAATRYMAAYYAEGRMADVQRVLATTLAAFLGLGAILSALLVGFTEIAFFRVFPVPDAHVGEVRVAMYVYAGTLTLQFGILALKGLYAAVQDQVTLKAWETASRVTYAVVVAVAVAFRPSVLAVVVVEQVVVLGFAAAFALVARRRYPAAFTLNLALATRTTLRQIGGFGAHVFANYFTTYGVYQRAPDIFISVYLGAASLTYYAIISRIPRIIKTMTAAANAAATPFAAALEGLQMREKLGKLVLRGARYTYLLLTPTILFVLVFAEEILSLWMGPEFAWLGNMQRAFVVWQYLMFFVLYTNATITQREQYAQLLPYSLVANVGFILLIWLTIGRFELWSVLGAQIATIAVLGAGALAVQRSAHQFGFGVLFDEVAKLPILYGVGVALSLLVALKLTLAPAGIVTLLLALASTHMVYGLVVYRFGLDTAERSQLLRLARRAAGAH